MSVAGIVMDVVLMALLIAALMFGLRLDKRLKALRAGQEDFARAVADLDQAAIKAHESLSVLHTGTDESQELLHGRILVARDLMQKLDQKIARIEKIQIDLDRQLRTAGYAPPARQPEARQAEPEIPERPVRETAPQRPATRPVVSMPVSQVASEPQVPGTLSEAERMERLRQAIRANRLDIADVDGADEDEFDVPAFRSPQPAPARHDQRAQTQRALGGAAMRTRRMRIEREAHEPDVEITARDLDERLKLTENTMQGLNEVLGAMAEAPRARRPDLNREPEPRPEPRHTAPQRPVVPPQSSRLSQAELDALSAARRRSVFGDDLFDSEDRPVTRRTPPGDI